jgi:hypothetical protein
MTVDYSVSWEEYLQICKPHFPTADWASSVATVLIGIALMIVAIAVDWAGRLNGGTPAFMLLFISAGLIVTALWAPTVGTRIGRWRYIRRCRSAYREHFAGRQLQFMFDEETWASRSQSQDSEALWSEVTVAVEYEVVIFVQSEKHFVLVPKRVLSPEGLEQLRRLAFGRFISPLKLRVRLGEYMRTEIRTLWRRRRSGMMLAHATGILVAGAMIGSLWSPLSPQDALWVVLLAVCLLWITLSTQFVYFLVSYAIAWRRVHVGWQMECFDRGAHVRTATSEHFSSWSVFPKFEETRRAFLLYSDAEQYYILPKAGMKPEQQHGLRQMLLSKLQTA